MEPNAAVPRERGRFRWQVVLGAVLRESRAAKTRLLFLTGCLAIGVAAVVGVSALVAAMEAGIRAESRQLLGADLRVSARGPLPEALGAFFEGVPHERTDVFELAAMAASEVRGSTNEQAGGAVQSRLVELKVLDGLYPLYGELGLRPARPNEVGPGLALSGVAELGAEAVFAGPELLAALELNVGDSVLIGGASYRLAAEVTDEPDRLDFSMSFGPRVFMTAEGLARTGLLESKSRVRYRALFRLSQDTDARTLSALAEELRDALGRSAFLDVRAHSVSQPNVGSSLGRVGEFLGLVALLSLLLGGIGVAQIVRAWLAGRTQSVAVLRSLGFRAREIAGLYLAHVALLACVGSVVGAALGALLPWGAHAVAPELFQGADAQLWQPVAFGRGIALGLLVALLFSLPPLAAVWRVPPAAVLRAEAVPLSAPRRVTWGASIALAGGVLLSAWLQGGRLGPALAFTGGLALLAALLWLAARGTEVLARRLPRGWAGAHVEHGLSALARPGAGTTGAVVALGIGVMVVLSMFLVERRLVHAMRRSLPEDAPTVFVVDVQPDQWAGVQRAFDDHGASSVNSVPVVMARLRAIDGRAVDELAREHEGRDGAWVFTREQRLTWLDELPSSNELVASSSENGRLWVDPNVTEVSLEEGYAADLGVDLGSRLRFDVQGVAVEFTVTSLRSVDWQSFQINFFLIAEPGALEGAPHFRLAAARLAGEAGEYALQNELAASHPNVTLLRVRPILEKVAGVLERLGLGVRALGSFTIVVGLVILAGATASSAQRRQREAALLKVLGVTRAGVARLFAVEYALGGLVAGTIGAAGALLLSWAFLEELAELEFSVPWLAIPCAALATAALATLSGLSASLRALAARPMETLRG